MSEFQEYPKWMYHRFCKDRIFNTPKEARFKKLLGWQDRPFPPPKIRPWLKNSFKPWWLEWEWLIKAFAVIVGAIGAIILLLKAFYL